MYPLADRVVLVTGASGGLGKALCAELLGKGARVVAADVDEQSLAQLVEELGGDRLKTHRLDVTDPQACARVVEQVIAEWSAIDVLINNAGVTHFSRFDVSELEGLRRVIDINLLGSINVTQAALPSIIQRRGMVVGLSSVAGFSPLYGRSAYSASKHGLEGFLSTLRVELAETGVRVLTVCPAFIQTQPVQRPASAPQGVARPGQASATAGRVMMPGEAAAAIVTAMERQQRRLLLGKVAYFAWFLSRLSPRLYEWVMVRQTRGEVES
ncbi:SDR family oxidoreductase [Aestuariirhabdus litorea]|uniref:SDR family oxidoreductase n=1 Tax=Aestuariirhabdus litorea TaxID=2528527 RepID=A0A3P3VLL2_9GAMM|nr:SDR family oxidoreductase [Aestuariirhabdus litorea]RRJ83641.1 SDR family oxidoreductase [Aestuariirhabdus litorea]RWW96862.1 SDR family oxidoreductase [Endozoicomonadaceae bacterium GTF-13]